MPGYIFEPLTKQDLALGVGQVAVTMPGGGNALGDRIGFHTFLPHAYNVQDFGARGDGVTDDGPAFAAALAALTEGGTLHVPTGTYRCARTLTLGVTGTAIQLAPGANLSFTAAAATAIAITADDCRVEGGTITLPATFDGTNTAPTYGVLWITGHRAAIDGVRFVNVPRVGVGFLGSNEGRVTNCVIDGNFPANDYTGLNTAHFGVLIDPGSTAPSGLFVIGHNIIRSCVQGIYAGDYAPTGAGIGYGFTITGNAFEGCHNHGIYAGTGRGTVVSGNSFVGCQCPVAITGDHAVVVGNALYTAGTGTGRDQTGISVREASHAIIAHNVIKGEAALSAVIDLTNLPTGGTSIDHNLVAHNLIEYTGQGGVEAQSFAIRLGSAVYTQTLAYNVVEGNIIQGQPPTFQALIQLTLKATYTGVYNRVVGNTITLSGLHGRGIDLTQQSIASVLDNTIVLEYDAADATTMYGLSLTACASCIVDGNVVKVTSAWGTNVTFVGIAEVTSGTGHVYRDNTVACDPTKLTAAIPWQTFGTSYTQSNRFGGQLLSGTVTIATGTEKTIVANTNVTAQSLIHLMPTNAAAGALMASKGWFITRQDRTSFTLGTADGAAVAADCTFAYVIV